MFLELVNSGRELVEDWLGLCDDLREYLNMFFYVVNFGFLLGLLLILVCLGLIFVVFESEGMDLAKGPLAQLRGISEVEFAHLALR